MNTAVCSPVLFPRSLQSSFLSPSTCNLLVASSVGASIGGFTGATIAGPLGMGLGGALGAIVGTVVFIALRYFSKVSQALSVFAKDRKFIASLSTDPRISPALKESLSKVKTFVNRAFFSVRQAFELHAFHNELVEVSRFISDKEDLKGQWMSFLQRLNGVSVRYPDATFHPIETDMAIRVASKIKISVKIDRFDPNSSESSQQMQELFSVAQECLTSSAAGRTSEVFAKMISAPEAFCYLAKDSVTNKILGFVWGKIERYNTGLSLLHVCGLGRRASAAKLGIAEGLMASLHEEQVKSSLTSFLEVRVSNVAAQRLYTKWGYHQQNLIPNYYRYPAEPAYLMMRRCLAEHVA